MRLFSFFLCVASLLFFSFAAIAQNGTMRSAVSEKFMDDTPISLTPDGPAVIQFNEDVVNVIVGNPLHAKALIKNPRLLLLMPVQSGTTKLIVFNRAGKMLLNKRVLVNASRDGFKRITRLCSNSKVNTCQPVSMYYCPDKCYQSVLPDASTDVAATGNVLGSNQDVLFNSNGDSVVQ
jgi:Flp pilus assembly secretin CpaC